MLAVIVPAGVVEGFRYGAVAFEMLGVAEIGGDGADIALTSYDFGEGAPHVFDEALTWSGVIKMDDGAEEGDAVAGFAEDALIGVEGKTEGFEVVFDDFDIALELGELRLADDDEEVIHIAAVVLVAEGFGDELV